MLHSLAKEIEQRVDYLKGEPIRTLYFGGGTPTIYTPQELQLLTRKIKSIYTCNIEEFTVEANPDDLNPEYLQGLRSIGVNRLSIGIQSFIDRDLLLMNRRHNAQHAIEVVPMAKVAGFDNITIDLIYGIPGQSEEEWEYNLKTALSLDVQHISSYHLSIEPKTVFGNKQKRGLFRQIDDAASEKLYRILEEQLCNAGFEHYEVSNFARPGYYSKHNTAYWTYEKYIGIGPSAHSFDGISRQWNIANNSKYIKALTDGINFWEREQMNEGEQYNELILTSMRTTWGLKKADLEKMCSKIYIDYFYEAIQQHLKEGTLMDKGNAICIPTKHFLISDGIMADLFFVED